MSHLYCSLHENDFEEVEALERSEYLEDDLDEENKENNDSYSSYLKDLQAESPPYNDINAASPPYSPVSPPYSPPSRNSSQDSIPSATTANKTTNLQKNRLNSHSKLAAPSTSKNNQRYPKNVHGAPPYSPPPSPRNSSTPSGRTAQQITTKLQKQRLNTHPKLATSSCPSTINNTDSDHSAILKGCLNIMERNRPLDDCDHFFLSLSNQIKACNVSNVQKATIYKILQTDVSDFIVELSG